VVEQRQHQSRAAAEAAEHGPFAHTCASGELVLVYSSVGGAERHSGIPHFESKRRVEDLLTGLVPLSIVRPTFFMENLLYMIGRDGDDLTVRLPMPGDVPLQMISVRDIGSASCPA
jgi:uncharacterized protein YbjT (DUF2867 family)